MKNRVCIFNEKKASLAVFPSFKPGTGHPEVLARAEINHRSGEAGLVAKFYAPHQVYLTGGLMNSAW